MARHPVVRMDRRRRPCIAELVAVATVVEMVVAMVPEKCIQQSLRCSEETDRNR